MANSDPCRRSVGGGYRAKFHRRHGRQCDPGPVLALIIGARNAVRMVILINMITSIQLFPGALRSTRWRELMPMAATGLLTVPLGVYALLSLDQDLMRRAHVVSAGFLV